MRGEHEPPRAPDGVPQYVEDGLRRQDGETLRQISAFVEELLDYQMRPVEVEEVATDEEEVVDVEQDGEKGTIVEKKIPCGKDCDGCPHGPYKYRVYRDGGSVKTEYIGPV